MHMGSELLDRLVRVSREQREMHPLLKRLVLHAAHTALQQVTPNDYFHKCHGAALSMFMILRTLRIRTTICGGTVSWLFGGIDANGSAWQSRCGFWTPNSGLPTPHAWLMTEFGGVIDLTCSYFHLTMGSRLQGAHSHDVIPMIWMKTEHFNALPTLQYNAQTRYQATDLERCDDLAKRVVGQALVNFWGTRSANNLLQPCAEIDSLVAGIQPPQFDDNVLLDGLASIEELRASNTWVARNSRTPPMTTNSGLVT